MLKEVTTRALYDVQTPSVKALLDATEFPWEALPRIKEHIKSLLADLPEGFTVYAEGILVGEGVTVHPTATILPPAIIGKGTEIRPGAYLRGNVIIGEDCVIGNSTELKNCILLNHVQVPHYNYVGDSILGNYAHMGAGAVCSNFKADGKNIVVHGDQEYETGLRKFGAMLGDRADIGCGCVLNPGTVIGQRTSVYPLTSVRGVIPKDCIVKAMDAIVKREVRN